MDQQLVKQYVVYFVYDDNLVLVVNAESVTVENLLEGFDVLGRIITSKCRPDYVHHSGVILQKRLVGIDNLEVLLAHELRA